MDDIPLADAIKHPLRAFLALGRNATNNLKDTLDSMTPRKWLRLVIVVCAYVLFRRYFLVFAGRRQAAQYAQAEQEDEEDEQQRPRTTIMSPNDVRGGGLRLAAEIPDNSSGSDSGGDAAPSATATADWGKRARRRQRRVMRKLVDDAERKLRDQAGEEDDRDIQEFLVE